MSAFLFEIYFDFYFFFYILVINQGFVDTVNRRERFYLVILKTIDIKWSFLKGMKPTGKKV